MSRVDRGRTVYSTDRGAVCATCGWPQKSCRCSIALVQPVPERVTAVLRIEKSGRKGKTVTVIDRLPRNPDFLKKLATELKRHCGTGGSAGEDRVEVQGDHREALRVFLAAKGWTVKG
jgi:translation initiation factor 1